MDREGAVVWGRQFGTPEYDTAEGVASDALGNAYVAGMTYGSLAGSRGASDLFVRKYSPSGAVVWTRQFGTGDYDYVGDIAVYGSSVYVVGFTQGNLAGSQGGWDAFIRKYTDSGSVVWTKQFGTGAEDFAKDVAVDGLGNVYVVGYTYGTLAGTHGGDADMFIRKYSASGAVQWTRQRHYNDEDTGVAVATSGSHVYLVGGYNKSSDPFNPDPNVRVVKFSASGSTVWDKGYGPPGVDYVYDVSADPKGNFYLAGETYTSFSGVNKGGADGYVRQYTPAGSVVWSRQLGTPEYDATYAVLARTSSELYLAGTTYGTLGSSYSGNGDAYLRRTNAGTGSTVWTDQ